MLSRILSCLSLFTLLALTVGCGGGKSAPATVSGTVTYRGAPVTGGTLVFHSDAGIYSAGIGADGTYAIAGMPAGEMVVTVDTEGLNPKNAASPEYKGQTSGGPTGMYGGAGQGGSPAGAKNKAEASPIPEGASQGSQGGYIKIPGQYADKAKSPLKVTVDTGKQEINLELKD